MAKYRFGVQAKRDSDFSLILRRIAGQIGNTKGAYTVEDLNRDVIRAFINSAPTKEEFVSECEDCPLTTVYVRGSALDHQEFKTFAKEHNITMSVLLESALRKQLAESIKQQSKFVALLKKVSHANER